LSHLTHMIYLLFINRLAIRFVQRTFNLHIINLSDVKYYRLG